VGGGLRCEMRWISGRWIEVRAAVDCGGRWIEVRAVVNGWRRGEQVGMSKSDTTGESAEDGMSKSDTTEESARQCKGRWVAPSAV
jgi:hypothetical protein